MPHPPGRGNRLTPLLLLVVWLIAVSAAPARAYPSTESPDFYADMLFAHDRVFVSEELAGHLDRPQLADDLRARVREEGLRLDVLVVAHPTHTDLDWLAQSVRLSSGRPVVVFSPHTNRVGASHLSKAGLPSLVADFTTFTGAYPEDPREQLDRLLRAASYPDLEERTARAETEVLLRSGHEVGGNAAPPGWPTQRWLTVTWPSTVGLVVSAAGTALLVAGGAGVLRRLRRGTL
ncbi:hypothetical protein ABZ635_26895 [Nocardiopsis sp. NPDC007018]|uniref:hypothetical protein n=1 Tax=Nocardiopsis sp. NPDC007018 TaxID=3155721 RepID=UPI0033F048A9